MTLNRLATLCAATLFAAVLFAPEVRAQAAKKTPEPVVYTVGKGETIVTIANKVRYPSATENQMLYALVRRNPAAARCQADDTRREDRALLQGRLR